jgi:hypothetical protein
MGSISAAIDSGKAIAVEAAPAKAFHVFVLCEPAANELSTPLP